MGNRVNPDTIGCVWTGEFDFNTLRVDGEIFESGREKLRIQKYPDTCGRGLNVPYNCQLHSKFNWHVQYGGRRVITTTTKWHKLSHVV